jgi:uncharacterized protein YuzB (UPF0349 family)
VSKPRTIVVEFCEHNVNRATRGWLLELNRHDGLKVTARGCLCRCTRCFDKPSLRIDGRDIEGPTHRDIAEETIAPLLANISVPQPACEP